MKPFEKKTYPPLFILGAGFSHSFNKDFFPLTNELLRIAFNSNTIENNSPLQSFINEFFSEDEDVNFEKVASFLLNNPFLSVNELPLTYEMLYWELMGIISNTLGNRKFIDNSEEKNIKLLRLFVQHLQKEKSTIISFNYDLILENFLKDTNWNPLYGYGIDFYKPSTNRHYPSFSIEGNPLLLKLHGSLNWGIIPENLNNLANSLLYLYDGRYDEPIHTLNIKGKFNEQYKYYPYLIPPIVGKSYQHKEIRKLWNIARSILDYSGKIHIIGFSLPESDVIVEYLFRSITNREREIHIVSPSICSDMCLRYEKVFRTKENNSKQEIIFHNKDAMDYLENYLKDNGYN